MACAWEQAWEPWTWSHPLLGSGIGFSTTANNFLWNAPGFSMAASVGDVITAETCSSLSIRTGPWPPSQGPSLKPGQQHNTAQVQRLGGTSLASAYRESAWQQKVPLCSSNAVEWQPVHINLQQTWPSQHVSVHLKKQNWNSSLPIPAYLARMFLGGTGECSHLQHIVNG